MSSDTTDGSILESAALLAGRYRVQRRLGGGGMADVYLAEDTRLERLVAVKILKPHFAEDAEFVERFRVEARAAALLSHPNIVAVFDRGVDGPPWYIAMEYVAGESLKVRLRREGALEPHEAARIATAVLAALQAAHERHVVHRDVTSANVLLDPSGCVKVADFGIARIGVSALTRTGTMLGTSSYLSPEQAQGKAADERSDLYSLGVVLFEMLTGCVPFAADSDVAVALKHVSEPAPDPRLLRPELPGALAAVVRQAMAKEPGARYQSAAECAAALATALPGGSPPPPRAPSRTPSASTCAEQGPMTARTVYTASKSATVEAAQAPTRVAPEPAAHVAADPPTRVAAEPATTVLPRRRRRWIWVVAAVVLAAAAAGVWAVLTFALDDPLSVPHVVGRTEAAALTSLKDLGLRPVIHRRYVDAYDEGVVSRQLPRAGEEAADGARVDIWVSRGPLHIPAPDLDGLTPSAADRRLEKHGLAGVSHRSATTNVPAGEVYRQEPAAGEKVRRGDVVDYWVSTGLPRIEVPDVVGLSAGDAVAMLEDRGLVASIDYVVGLGEIPGDVISQDPAGGTRLRKGDEVIIEVAIL